METKKLLLNSIKTPDGTVLTSRHRHDYVTYTDKNGLVYMVDGGLDYLRRNAHESAPYTELSVYSDAPFEVIREVVERGSCGVSGKEELKYIKLKDVDDDYLEALIEYEEELRPNNPYLVYYKQEQKYRNEKKV